MSDKHVQAINRTKRLEYDDVDYSAKLSLQWGSGEYPPDIMRIEFSWDEESDEPFISIKILNNKISYNVDGGERM